MSEWQPIETAPKDGTWFLASREGEGPEDFELGCYEPYYFDEYEEAGDGLFKKQKRLLGEWRGFNNMHRMTHWMPLPAAPSLTGEQK